MPAPRRHLLLLLAAGLVVYGNSFAVPFQYDDVPSIQDNAHIRRLWPLSRALTAPDDTTAVGRPAVCFSLAVNYALGGLDVRGYHAFNLAVHLLAALALYGLVRRTLAGPRLAPTYGADAGVTALAVALLWVVHPLQTECVTYLIQRAESMMALFFLLTLYASVRALDAPRPRRWSAVAIAACACGMAAKEVMAGAPLLVALYDRTFHFDSFAAAWRKRRGLYLGLAAGWIVLGLSLASGTRSRSAGFAFEDVTWIDYLVTQCGVIVHYLVLCFLPWPQCFHLDWPIARGFAAVVPAGCALVALLAATAWALRRRPAAGFLGAAFFVVLAPSSSFVPIVTEVAAEHRMYLPLAAVLALAVTAARRLRARALVVVAIAVLFGGLTLARNEVYASPLSLWRDVIAQRPMDETAHNNLGFALDRAGRTDEAIPCFREALRIEPRYALAHANLGNALARQGHAEEAAAEYATALRQRSDLLDAHYNLGLLRLRQGRGAEAIEQFTESIRLAPDFAMGHVNLGIALKRAGRIDEALAHLRQSLAIDPALVEGHYAIADLDLRQGRVAEAIAHYRAAVAPWEGSQAATNQLAWLLAVYDAPEIRVPAEAVTLAERLCRDTHDGNAEYLDTLAAAYASAGRFRDAEESARRAIAAARKAGRAELAADIERRLALYAADRPYLIGAR